VSPLSVVVPTRGRPAALERLLASLDADRRAGSVADVVVAIDGDDDTASAAVARRHGARVASQRWSGRAAARNLGAEAAGGDRLLFLDDDVEALPGLAAAHTAAAGGDPAAVSLGDYPVVLGTHPTPAERAVWAWWEDAHHSRRHAPRLDATHVWSGNLAISRSLFDAVGGFDTGFRRYGGEDIELGQRLVVAGARLTLLPDVLARHHARVDVRTFLARAGDEAVAHVRLATLHPDLAPFTPLAGRPHTRVARLAARAPRVGAVASDVLGFAVPFADGLGLRRTTARLLRAVREERYWRAAGDVSGGRGPRVDPAVVTIDVGDGVDERVLAALPAGVPVRLALVEGDALLTVVTVTLDPAVPRRVALASALAGHAAAARLAAGGTGRNSPDPHRTESRGGSSCSTAP
jgi:GT2 family glycosyltransferase